MTSVMVNLYLVVPEAGAQKIPSVASTGVPGCPEILGRMRQIVSIDSTVKGPATKGHTTGGGVDVTCCVGFGVMI